MRTYVLWALVAAFLFGIAGGAAADRDYDEHGANVTIINTYGVAPFVYSGYSYVPLKTTADFLGAALLWDSLQNRATLSYHGRQLGLVVGSTTAYYMGQPVALPVAPVIVEGQLLAPVIVFDRYLDVPVRWEPDRERVLLLGPGGWGYYPVLPYAPPYVVTIIQGYGPPPWAPAYGHRRRYYPQIYAPAPFVYYGVTYLPLRDAAGIIGAALLWDSLHNRAVLTYNGRELGLVIGSPTVYYGTQVIVLPAPPVIVGGAVYVPSTLFDRHLNIPVQSEKGLLKLKGPRGWHDFQVASAPPAHVYGVPQTAQERERERSSFGLPTQRGPEPGRSSGPWTTTQQRPGAEPGRGSGPWMRRTQSAPAVKSPPPAAKSPPPAKAAPAPAKKEKPEETGKKGGGWFQAKDKAKGD